MKFFSFSSFFPFFFLLFFFPPPPAIFSAIGEKNLHETFFVRHETKVSTVSLRRNPCSLRFDKKCQWMQRKAAEERYSVISLVKSHSSLKSFGVIDRYKPILKTQKSMSNSFFITRGAGIIRMHPTSLSFKCRYSSSFLMIFRHICE